MHKFASNKLARTELQPLLVKIVMIDMLFFSDLASREDHEAHTPPVTHVPTPL